MKCHASSGELSSERKEIEVILVKLLEGRITSAEALDGLKAYISVDFSSAPDFRVIKCNDLDGIFEISVYPENLKTMLELFLYGKISELELSNWAAFIYMTGIFIPEGETEEERWEAGDGPVWNIIQEIITPNLFAGLGPERISYYLQSIDSI